MVERSEPDPGGSRVGALSIVLAGDTPVLREGLRAILGSEPGIRIVGDAADRMQILRLVERLRPDVLVLDAVFTSGLNSLDLVQEVRQQYPATRVLMGAPDANASDVREAFERGATGYVLASSSQSEIREAVRRVAAAERYVTPSLRSSPAALASAATDSVPGLTRDPDRYATLTPRQQEVIRLAVDGLSSREIGTQLGISARTVHVHRQTAMHKLHLRTQTELVRYALARRLLPA